jgi:cytochrome c biogenesis protein CcdA
MNYRTVIFCVIGLMFVTALASPRLAIPPEGVAFGEIAAGEAASKSIELRNASPSPVAVSHVKGCCGAEASLSSMRIEPSSSVTLSVSLKAMLPGEFSKHVQILCDDPESPVINIPVTGTAVESKTAAASLWTLPTVVLAGIVDGFNPCSFAIMISLAGILAIGGRKRRARIIGGLAFCAGTFVTYMLMGLGLMQALKALEGLRVVHDVVMVVLALALFVLSFLSFRDALKFKKVPVFSVVTLKLPEGVKVLIRKIAMESWSGPAVALAGFGCAFLVTLLDALCTGQVYVPVLALISHEPGAWRSFALLVVYNLAFVAPLVAVFILASRTTDAFQMAKWSSRNVIPAKVALGVVFALLGVLVLLGTGFLGHAGIGIRYN